MLPYPDELVHNNAQLPLVDQSQVKGGFQTVADITARDSFPTAKRKEGMLFNVLSPYSWYQLIGGVDNDKFVETKINTISPSTDIDLYISTTGNDTTGDGSSGTPYLTLGRAVDDIPGFVADITIRFYFIGIFTMSEWDNVKYKLSTKTYSNVRIEWYGDVEVIEAGISLAEKATNTCEYTASKAGVTVTENQWRGYFISDGDGAKFYPIPYNGAGTDSFDLTHMRGNRGGSRDVVNIVTTFDLTGLDTRTLVMNFPGVSGMLFRKIKFVATTEISFELLTIPYEFDFGVIFDCLQIITGGYNNMSLSALNFVGTIIKSSITIRPAFEQRDNMGEHSFVRCMLWTPSLIFSGTSILSVSHQSRLKIREVAFVGNNKLHSAITSIGGGGVASISKTIICYDIDSIILNRFGNWVYECNFTEGYVYTLLRNVNYLIDNTYDAVGFVADIFSYDNDGNLISTLKSTKKEYLSLKNGTRINIVNTYPEVENQSELTIPNNQTATSIQVGDITENKSVTIDYYFTRGTLEGKGIIILTNSPGTDLLENSGKGDDHLIIFSKLISGNELRLAYNDQDAPDGNDTVITYSITRKMILS